MNREKDLQVKRDEMSRQRQGKEMRPSGDFPVPKRADHLSFKGAFVERL